MDTTTESRGLRCTALRVALGTSLPAAQQAVVVVVTVCRRRSRVCRSRVCRPRAAPYDLSCKRFIEGIALHGGPGEMSLRAKRAGFHSPNWTLFPSTPRAGEERFSRDALYALSCKRFIEGSVRRRRSWAVVPLSHMRIVAGLVPTTCSHRAMPKRRLHPLRAALRDLDKRPQYAESAGHCTAHGDGTGRARRRGRFGGL